MISATATGCVSRMHLPRLDLSQLQQVVGQSSQPQGVFANYFQKTAAVLSILERASEQSLRKSLDCRKRRFEFVRNVGDEIPARPLQSSDFGDIVQHHDRARRGAFGAYRRRCDGIAACPDGSDSHFPVNSFPAGQSFLNEGEQVRMTDEFHYGTPLTGHVRNACRRQKAPLQ